MPENRTGIFVGGLMLGTAVGTVVGLLLAPRSGRETRKILKKSAEVLPEVAEDVTTNLHYQTERLLDSAQKSLDETMIRLQEAIATGKEAMVQRREELDQQWVVTSPGSQPADPQAPLDPTLARSPLQPDPNAPPNASESAQSNSGASDTPPI